MKRAQTGFGLIEMMIALVIGLVLLLGLTTILLSMTRTAELRRKMAEVQGAQRMAMTLIGNSLRYAGAFPFAGTDTAATVFPASATFGVGQSVIGTADTVSVRFIASSSQTASQGCTPTLTAGRSYTNVYSIEGGYLRCVETDGTSGTVTTVDLIAGLSGMDILYGVDTTGEGFVTKYMTANQVTSPTNFWDNVKTVKVTLIFINPMVGEAGQADMPTLSISQTIPHAIGL